MAVLSRVCQVTYCQFVALDQEMSDHRRMQDYSALVMSRWITAMLFGLPEMLLHKLQMIQNSAARPGTHGRDHITPVLFKLHWLPVRYRIELLLVLMYQAVHHLPILRHW